MKKKMIDWYRVGRTALQAGSGAAVAFLATLAAGQMSRTSFVTGAIEFVGTVLTAVLMNLNKQAKEADTYGDDCE